MPIILSLFLCLFHKMTISFMLPQRFTKFATSFSSLHKTTKKNVFISAAASSSWSLSKFQRYSAFHLYTKMKPNHLQMMDHVQSFTTKSITKTALITSSIVGLANAKLFTTKSLAADMNILSQSMLTSNVLDVATAAAVTGVNETVVTDREIIKRKNDNKKYETFTLPNGIRVLLVSDPTSVSAAAAVDVHVGSFSDPKDIPGLAHFCEHMSFLGNEKYPKETDYSTFLSSHGGSSNAYTDAEDTVYYFDINAEYFDGALERFSEFFISPLFTQTATTRELNAIDSEHAKNINNDEFRVFQLEKDFAYPYHPLSKFPTGTKQTLEAIPKQKKIDVRQALIEFHQRYYSSNQMTLCVYGPQSITQLKQYATRYFSLIKNKHIPNPSLLWWGKIPPFAPQLYASVIEVAPVNELRRLVVNFPVFIPTATDRNQLLKLKPEMVIAHLLGHEGSGSVLTYLKSRNWANGVQTGISFDISDLQMMEVSVDLTEEGLKQRDAIIDVIFAYLNMLRTTMAGHTSVNGENSSEYKLKKYVLQEVSQLSNISFEYSENSEPIDFVSSLVADMQMYPLEPKEYLVQPHTYPYIPTDNNNDNNNNDNNKNQDVLKNQLYVSVQTYLNHFHPSQCRIRVVSPTFKHRKNNKIAPYYGTEYQHYVLPEQTKRWEAIFTAHVSSRITPHRDIDDTTRLQDMLRNSKNTSLLDIYNKYITTINANTDPSSQEFVQSDAVSVGEGGQQEQEQDTTRLQDLIEQLEESDKENKLPSVFTPTATTATTAGATASSATKLTLSELHLPTPNTLIPQHFQLVSPLPVNKPISATQKLKLLNIPPEILIDTNRYKVYYKVDQYFNQPKAYFVMNYAIKEELYTVEMIIKYKLFISCFLDSINEYLYDARLAGLSFQLELVSRGLQMTFAGYNDKFSSFVIYILQALKSYEPDVPSFNRFKELLSREFKSWYIQQPYFHASYYTNLISESFQFEISEFEKVLSKQEIINIDSISNQFIDNVLVQSYVTALIIGNIKKDEAKTLIQNVDNCFPFAALPSTQRLLKQVYKIPTLQEYYSGINSISDSDNNSKGGNKVKVSNSNTNANAKAATATKAVVGGYILTHLEPNANDDNSAVSFYFQLPSRSIEDYLLVELLADIVEQPFYDSLRTQQQLGYIVYSGVKSRQGINHLLLTVQSAIVHGDELVSRIESCIVNTLLPYINSMDKSTFDEFRNGIIARKSEPDRRLTSQASRFWSEILYSETLSLLEERLHDGNTNAVPSVSPEFDRYEKECKVLTKINLRKFQLFARQFLSCNSSVQQQQQQQSALDSDSDSDNNSSIDVSSSSKQQAKGVQRLALISRIDSIKKSTTTTTATSTTTSGSTSTGNGGGVNNLVIEYIDITTTTTGVTGSGGSGGVRGKISTIVI